MPGTLSIPWFDQPFFHYTGMTSLYTLMGLSVERWLIITRPGKFSLNSYTTTSIIMVIYILLKIKACGQSYWQAANRKNINHKTSYLCLQQIFKQHFSVQNMTF